MGKFVLWYVYSNSNMDSMKFLFRVGLDKNFLNVEGQMFLDDVKDVEDDDVIEFLIKFIQLWI